MRWAAMWFRIVVSSHGVVQGTPDRVFKSRNLGSFRPLESIVMRGWAVSGSVDVDTGRFIPGETTASAIRGGRNIEARGPAKPFAEITHDILGGTR